MQLFVLFYSFFIFYFKYTVVKYPYGFLHPKLLKPDFYGKEMK